MQETAITALLVEDDLDEVLLMREAISDAGATDITLEHCENLKLGLDRLAKGSFDAVLLDLSLPDTIGLEGVRPIVDAAGEATVIVCTGLDDQDIAQEAIRIGAQDFLVKNPRLYGAMPRILRYAVERNRLINSANKKVDQARQYTELLLTNVISIANAGLGITSGDGNFILVNPALAELVGCPQSALIGKPWTNLLPEGDRATELAAYVAAFGSDKDYDQKELTIQRTDGSSVPVPMRSIFVDFSSNRSCRVLSFGNPPEITAAAQGAGPDDQFGDKMKKRVGSSAKKVATGRVKIVGIEKIKAELGDRWQEVAERVFAMAERTIERRLAPSDSYARNSDGDFIICFGELSEQEAGFKAQAISHEIRQKILGCGEEGDFDDFGLDAGQLADVAEVRSEAHSLDVASDEVENALQIAALITHKMEEAGKRAKAKSNILLAQIHKSCRTRLREVHKADRSATAFMMHDFDPDTRLRVTQLMNMADEDPKTVADLDCIALGSAARHIHDLSAAKIPLIVVGVDYSTIINKTLFNEYSTVCRSLNKRVKMSLVFNITGIPSSIHKNTLIEVSYALSPYSRLRMIQPRQMDVRDFDLRESRISFVAADYDSLLGAYFRDPIKCRKDVKRVHAAGARLLVDGVTSRDGSHLFRELGVDFICYQPATELDTWIASQRSPRTATKSPAPPKKNASAG